MCYDYINSHNVLNETQLPPIQAFKSTLTGEDITKEDYNRAQLVWEKFNCKTMNDYLHLYLEQDVLLLTDAI